MYIFFLFWKVFWNSADLRRFLNGQTYFGIFERNFEILSSNSPLNLTFLKDFLKVSLYKASLIMIIHFLGVFERLFERKLPFKKPFKKIHVIFFERFFERYIILAKKLPFKKPFKKIHVIFFERFFERYYTPTCFSVPSKACTYFSVFERFFEIQQIKGPFWMGKRIFAILKGFLKSYPLIALLI